MSTRLQFTDGFLGQARLLTPFAPFSYPFANAPTPDTYARERRRSYDVAPRAFAPSIGSRSEFSNLLTWSADLANAAWSSNAGVTVTANAARNPWNGGPTGSRVRETAAKVIHGYGRPYTFPGSVQFAWTNIARGVGRDFLLLGMNDGTTTKSATFNLTTGVVVSVDSGATATILALGENCYACTLVWTPSAGTGFVVGYPSPDGTSISYAGSTSAGVDVLHAQLEQAAGWTTLVETAGTAGVSLIPPTDYNLHQAADPTADRWAYLVEESMPQMGNASRATFNRLFSRIPATQYLPAAASFTRPPLNNIKSGSTYAVSFDAGLTSHLFQSRKSVSRTSSRAAVTVSAGLPSSNITYTKGVTSVSIPANTATGTIKSTLEATFAGVIFYVSSSSSTVTIQADTLFAIDSVSYDADEVGLVFSNGNYIVYYPTGTVTTPEVTVITATAHGGTEGSKVAIWSNDTLLGTSVVVAVGNADQVSVLTADILAANMPITHIAFAAAAYKRIAIDPPLRSVSARTVQRFYLPGVSAGVASADQIPAFEPQVDAISFLEAVLAYFASPSPASYLVADSGEIAQWRGPILSKTVTEIQLQDVVIEVPVGA